MKLTTFVFVMVFTISGCSLNLKRNSGHFKVKEEIFGDLDTCFIAYDLKQDKVLAERGGATCTTRVPALSTFKIPLALMAFDSKILVDENTTLSWDGTEYPNTAWNQDQTAQSWMKESVVWYSQLLTPKLGAPKIAAYLKQFNYGNQDFSGGITAAWLNGKAKTRASLLISTREQLEFMKNFWKQKFQLSPIAYQKTKLIMQLESLPHGYFLSGKTGSGFIGDRNRTRLGWFVGHIEGQGFDILTVLKFTDNDVQSMNRPGGSQAKDMTLKILRNNGL